MVAAGFFGLVVFLATGLPAGFADFGTGGAGISSAITGFGRNSGMPKPAATGSIFSVVG